MLIQRLQPFPEDAAPADVLPALEAVAVALGGADETGRVRIDTNWGIDDDVGCSACAGGLNV